MPQPYANPTKIAWDQSGFARMLDGFSADRLSADNDALLDIFDCAESSPTARAALAWAQAHGVRFFVDRKVEGTSAYYTPGTGVVGISAKHLRGDDAAAVLVHEIRHAWQDAHGLVPQATSDYAGYAIQNALLEADACAHQSLVARELKAASSTAWTLRWKASIFGTTKDKAAGNKGGVMAEAFLNWFSGNRARDYGEDLARNYGSYLGLCAVQPDSYEFGPAHTGHARNIAGEQGVPLGAGIDINDLQRVMQLGHSFAGVNYLAHMQDGLLKKILRPSLALTFYNAANDDEKNLSLAIQKEHLRQKAARPKRAPLGMR